MANIYDLVKSNITDVMISNAAKTLGENNTQVNETVNILIPTLMSGMLHKGNNRQVQDVIAEAHRKNILQGKEKMFESFGETEQTAIGKKFIEAVMGEKESALHKLIAGQELMSNENTRKLLPPISAIMAAVLGGRLAAHNNDMPKLINDLAAEQDDFMSCMPETWKNRLGLTGVVPRPAAKAAATTAAAAATAKTAEKAVGKQPKPKKKHNWLWWLLAILLLLLLLWLLRGGCKNCHRGSVIAPVVVETPVIEDKVIITESMTAEGRDHILSLPDGRRIVVIRGEMEDRMIEFLNSDEYKNATNDELAKRWFEFDGIEFEFNSGTEFMEGSKIQADNLAHILRAYPDVKIIIGGYADKVGGEKINLQLSEQRAKTIKKIFVDDGISADRISTKGFGEQFATIPAEATNAERAHDRDIALRFAK